MGSPLLGTLQDIYRGADKSLARPGRKQARKHVRDARDFNNIETRAVIKFFFLQGKAPKEIHTILTEILACFLPGRAKDLSAPLYTVSSVCPVKSNRNVVSFLNPTEVYRDNKFEEEIHPGVYRGVDKSLARPGRKQARKHIRDPRDFNNIERRELSSSFLFRARQGAEGNSRHSDRNISLFP